MFILDDLVLALLGWIMPLSKTTPTLLMDLLAKQGVDAYRMPIEVFQTLADHLLARATNAAERSKLLGSGETRLHAWVMILAENEIPDIARVLRGKCPQTMDIAEKGFYTRTRETFERHGVSVPPASNRPYYLDAINP